DRDAVVANGHHRVGDLLAGRIEPGRSVVDVVGLPGQRRGGHVDRGRGLSIDGGAAGLFWLQGEAVPDLYFLPAPLINAAGAPPLTARLGLEGSAELEVEREIRESLLAGHPHVEQIALD